MRLPPAFSDRRALEQAHGILRTSGLSALGVVLIVTILGHLIDLDGADRMQQLRYVVMIILPMAWVGTMIGGILLLEARTLQLWLRGRKNGSSSRTITMMNLTIALSVVGINLVGGSLTIAACVCYVAVDAGLVI